MTSIKIWLRANERIYVNGAVMRFDRKTSLELLNDVNFLLEKQVMQPEQVTTPLKLLYFRTQEALMNADQSRSTNMALLRELDQQSLEAVGEHWADTGGEIRRLVVLRRYHEAMKKLRDLFKRETPIDNREASASELLAETQP